MQYTGIEAAIFAHLNAQRAQCGLPAYRENTILDAATRAHAQHNADVNSNEPGEGSTDAGYTGLPPAHLPRPGILPQQSALGWHPFPSDQTVGKSAAHRFDIHTIDSVVIP